MKSRLPTPRSSPSQQISLSLIKERIIPVDLHSDVSVTYVLSVAYASRKCYEITWSKAQRNVDLPNDTLPEY